jgi:hypothetical protein
MGYMIAKNDMPFPICDIGANKPQCDAQNSLEYRVEAEFGKDRQENQSVHYAERHFGQKRE